MQLDPLALLRGDQISNVSEIASTNSSFSVTNSESVDNFLEIVSDKVRRPINVWLELSAFTNLLKDSFSTNA